jgi:hypothetical protein
MTDWSVTPLDQIPEETVGRCPWRPIRLVLGITSFGVNSWTAKAAGDRVINEHDEEDENEEPYLVLSGRATFELGGERRDAPTGSVVFVAPGVPRTAFAEEAGTTILAVGGQPGEVYVATGYELWSPLRPLFQEQRHDEVVERGEALVQEHPEYPEVAYNVACAAARAGRTEQALNLLRIAITGSPRAATWARVDDDLASLRGEPGFRALIGD